MATIKEQRYILATNLRQVCIDQDYFNAGTNEEYDLLFSYITDENGIPTVLGTVELYNLACMIYDHTRFCQMITDQMAKNDIIANIMYNLNKACGYYFEVGSI